MYLSKFAQWMYPKDLSKVIVSFSTKSESVDVFERIIISRFSCRNTRLAFDSTILLQKDTGSQETLKFQKFLQNIALAFLRVGTGTQYTNHRVNNIIKNQTLPIIINLKATKTRIATIIWHEKWKHIQNN